jgi:phosphoglycolate phosphatase-like HAD superfamily hydrolase
MPKIDKIYLDMDGVICDFDKRYEELYGYNPHKVKDKNRWKENFDDFIKTRQFATLDLMPGAMTLLHGLAMSGVPVEILSSSAREDVAKEISEQKEEWLKKYHIDFPRNFPPGKRYKYKYAAPSYLIIDDTLSVIEDWKEAGGPAIHFKNVKDTMAMLKFYLLGEK